MLLSDRVSKVTKPPLPLANPVATSVYCVSMLKLVVSLKTWVVVPV